MHGRVPGPLLPSGQFITHEDKGLKVKLTTASTHPCATLSVCDQCGLFFDFFIYIFLIQKTHLPGTLPIAN